MLSLMRKRFRIRTRRHANFAFQARVVIKPKIQPWRSNGIEIGWVQKKTNASLLAEPAKLRC